LKYIIAPRYWNHDSSLSADWILLGEKDIPYLQGIVDVQARGHEDAHKLISLIEKHDSIEIALL
jgi:hypothetical protein